MQKLLVDANIVTEYLKSNEGILAALLNKYDLYLSVVSYTELLASHRAADPGVFKQISDFVEGNFTLLPITEKIATSAPALLRSLDIALADAYLAATALTHDLPLLTLEMKVFDQVPNLKLVDI
jgi:predicted nucleic acid-binding protein